MAVIIPDRLPYKPSMGEKRTYDLLKKLPDDYIVYYEPTINNRHPDFIVIAPDLGVIVIEVKGWYKQNIIKANNNEVTVIIDNVEQTCDHPLKQARKYMWNLVDSIRRNQNSSQLLHENGPYKNKFTFPFAHFVILSNITQKALDTTTDGYSLNTVFRPENTMTGDVLKKLEQASTQEIVQKIKTYFDPFWKITPLTSEQIDVLRAAIHPECILSYTPFESLNTQKWTTEPLKVLDLRQENNSQKIGEGHRIICGVAGSGKTVLLISRARLLHERDKDAKILLLCYNFALAKYLQKILSDYPRVNVTHFDDWSKQNGVTRSPDPVSRKLEDDFSLGRRLLAHLKMKSGDYLTYDAVLIDEAQDFHPSWFPCILQAMKDPDNGDLLIVCDGNQGIRPIGTFSWKSLGIKAQGRTLHTALDLDRNYRNTYEILKLASYYSPKKFQFDEDSMRTIPVDPNQAQRHGTKPFLVGCNDHQDECSKAIVILKDLLEGKLPNGEIIEKISPEEIGILYRKAYKNDKLSLINIIREFEPINNIIWVSETRDTRQKVIENGIKLQTVDSAKGLQYKAVLVLWPDSFIPHNQDEQALDNNRFYVALTRAENYLFLMNSIPNPISDIILDSDDVIKC